MPKAMQFKANSVIYFSGDFDERVFLLNKGNIALNSIDIITGVQVTEYIKTGEFFGVKSALGNYRREETAIVLTDSSLYVFTSKEFEDFAQTNTRIILQMLKVFSRQLRTIHRQLATLLDSAEETDAEEGLFNVMNAFYNSKHFKAAGQVGESYRRIYPGGKYISQVNQLVQSANDGAGHSFGTADSFEDVVQSRTSAAPTGDLSLAFKLGENLFAEGKYEDAYNQYHIVIEADLTDDTGQAAYLGGGKCLFFQKEYVRCLQLLSGFISKNPKSLKIAEALMYLGLCYKEMDRPDKAVAFFDKAALLAGPLLLPKIKELQAECGTLLEEK